MVYSHYLSHLPLPTQIRSQLKVLSRMQIKHKDVTYKKLCFILICQLYSPTLFISFFYLSFFVVLYIYSANSCNVCQLLVPTRFLLC